MVETVSIDIEMSDGGHELEFFNEKFTPELRRLVIEIGLDTFNICKDYVTLDDKKKSLAKLKNKLKDEYQSNYLKYKIESQEQKKQLAMLKEQNDFLKRQITETKRYNQDKIDGMFTTCLDIKSSIDKDIITRDSTSSSNIGKEGEDRLIDILTKKYPSMEVIDAHAEGHQGDIHCVIDDGIKVMIDSKNFKSNVGKKDREKFYEDMRANPSFQAGILFSHKSGIATKKDLDIELVDGKPVFYICNGIDNLLKLDLIFNFIIIYNKNNKKMCIKELDVFTQLLKNCSRRNTALIKNLDSIEKNAIQMREKLVENVEELKHMLKLTLS